MAPKRKTILVIDDEASVRKVINKILVNRGYGVLEAENYDEAAAMMNDGLHRIDMLLIDVSLPGKNGFVLAKALREIDPNLKVVFMSAPVGAEWLRYHGVPLTDVHFLPKPFGAAELLERVKYVLAWTAPLSARGAW